MLIVQLLIEKSILFSRFSKHKTSNTSQQIFTARDLGSNGVCSHPNCTKIGGQQQFLNPNTVFTKYVAHNGQYCKRKIQYMCTIRWKQIHFHFLFGWLVYKVLKRVFFFLCEERTTDLQYYIPLYTFANKKYHYCIHTSDKSAREWLVDMPFYYCSCLVFSSQNKRKSQDP